MIEKRNTEAYTYRADPRTEHFLISAASGGKENKILAQRNDANGPKVQPDTLTARHVMMSSKSYIISFEHSTSMINALRPRPYMTLNPSSFLIILYDEYQFRFGYQKNQTMYIVYF